MAEMAHTREYHRDTMLISSSNGFVITHRTTWLNDSRDTYFSSIVDAITEREERI